MKTRYYKKIAMFMAFVLIVPMFWSMNVAVARAATPSFVQTKVEIVGTGETYQLDIKDKVDKSKYNWTSTNQDVATVTDKGLITSIGRGSATIRCKITYPSKKTKTLSCKVSVLLPATEITITNATLVNGAYVMALNSTMDFDTTVMPVNSTDKVYWSVGVGDTSCIRIDDAANGRVTAIKAGKVTLVATAAKSATKEAADSSIINDAIIIEVVGPTATVKSAEISASNIISVVFDSPVNPGTVINADKTLSDNITLSLSKDTKGVLASDPGALTAELSSDNKTLTITAKNSFTGYYGINFSSSIKTADGTALESYYKKLYYIDTTPPAYSTTTVDDSGYLATITFTEALNYTNLKISGAALVSTSGITANATSLSVLNNVLNYTISQDKKSITINLKNISAVDYGKLFQIYISGVTDLSGNAPSGMFMTAYLQTDTSYKPQAQIMSVLRTSYDVITVTFDRAIQIQMPGQIQIAGGSNYVGVVDSTNNQKVNYTISANEALGTGVKTVSVGFFNAFNVNPADTSANTMQSRFVDFTADVSLPILVGSSYDTDKAVLTLTYSENVNLAAASGIFVSIYTSNTDDIRPNTNITYTRITHTEGNHIIKLQLAGVSTMGTYTFTMAQGFVTDNFRNRSDTRAMVITTSSGTSTELPGPYSIAQASTNLSQINVRFLYKLDIATAQNISNYTIAGLTIVSATLTENTNTGSTVILTIADSSIVAEVARPVTIKGVMGYNNSYSAITNYSSSVTLKENVKPTCSGAVFDAAARNIVRLNFSEAITGTISVKVTSSYNTNTVEIPSSVSINGSSVVLNLTGYPTSGSFLRIDILSSNLTDSNGNAVTAMQPSYMTVVN